MSIQIGLRQAEKQRIKFSFRIPFLPDPKQRISKKSSKKIQKIKKKKNHCGIISIQMGLRLAEKEMKKILFRIRFLPDPGQRIPKKIAKKFKKLKNIILVLFLSKPGRYRLRKREKFSFRISFLPDLGQRIRKKKQQKNSKNLKTSFWHYLYPNQAKIGREGEKKNFFPT